MRIISGLTLFFYTVVLISLGGLLVAVSLNIITQDGIMETVSSLYAATNVRMALGIAGILLILISILVVQLAMGKFQRERTIAFENPDGQVTISLTAIEDFIKRAVKQIHEVKELKPSAKANKKGILIINRVTLYSDINIPEVTEKIQNVVKMRVQDMLGVEEPVTVRVHVVKIVHKEEPPKDVKKDDKGQQFRGSIEYGNY